ncbi:amino acid adenylation domain-containing protein [Parafrankia soli]
MWFLQQLDPSSAAYNVAAAFDLTGPVDADALHAALRAVARGHEILRTTYRVPAGGRPEQVVHAELDPQWSSHDVSGEPSASRERLADEIARRAARRPFDLTSSSPLRVTLIRLAADRFVLVVVAHHVAWDDASWEIFFRELFAHYDNLRAGDGPLPADERTAQYIDVAGQPRGADAQDPDPAALDYWRGQLTALPEPLRLPGGEPVAAATAAGADPGKPADPGGQVVHQAAAGLGRRVRAFAVEHGATPFMVLLAAFAAVLHRHTGATDIVVGSPVVNRDQPGADRLIGYFGNTVALRVRVRPGDSFRDLLARTSETCRGAFAHQHVDLEDVVRAVNPDRSDGVSSVFTTLFAVRTAAAEHLGARELSGARRPLHTGDAQFPLGVTVEIGADQLDLEAGFLTAAVTAGSAGAVLRHLETFLDHATRHPRRPLAAVDLLTDSERRRTLVDWNDTAAPSPDATWAELLARRAARAPGHAAVVTSGGTLTYGELVGRADALAYRLRGLGAGPGTIVALALPRTLDLVVALAGVTRAGAAYLPVDPGYPADRITLVLEDAAPSLLITTRELAATLPIPAGVTVVLVNGPAAGTESGAEPGSVPEPPAVAAVPAELGSAAYVIYTSGSTGRPKGVVVPHRALTNFLASMVDQFQLGDGDRVLALTTLSFDIAALELLAPLTAGATVHLAGQDEARDPTALAALLAGGGITVAQATPSMWQSILAASDDRFPGVRVLSGGEGLPPAVATTLAERADEVVNLYGPTETTIWSTAGPVAGDGRPTVGRPIRSTQVYLLDTALAPVAPGMPGELYIGGAGVADGYLRRPGLTASRFVADPFSAGGRLYRTGDLARWTADGELDVLGRVDDQVKVRGFRIEPGEIEAVLGRHPAVARCAVVARDDGPAGRHLVAYVVPAAPGTVVDPALLREHLAAALPEHMVPGAFVQLAALPTTPNGKLDRRALPRPDFAAAAGSRAPATAAESLLCDLFGTVLGIERVGADDSFFHLGGDSILAFQVVAGARAAGLACVLPDIFRHPTPASLAAAAEQATVPPPADTALDADLAGVSAVDLERWRARYPDLTGVRPVSPLQAGLVFHSLLGDGSGTVPGAAGSDAYILQFVVDLRGRLDPARLRAAGRALFERHENLRTAFLYDGDAPVQIVLADLAPAAFDEVWTEVDLAGWPRAEALAEAERLGRADRQTPFDLTAPPLVRFLLLRTGPDAWRLVLSPHHVVLDGWSVPLLLRELFRRYELAQSQSQAQADGLAAALPPAPSYWEYLRWLAGRDRDASRRAWAAALAGVTEPTLLAAATARPSTPTQTAAHAPDQVPEQAPDQAVDQRDTVDGGVTAAVERHADAALTAGLGTFVRERGLTLNTVLRAAWAVVLGRAVGRDDVVFGTSVAGRPAELPGAAEMIGLLLATVPVRVTLDPAESFVGLLDRVRADQTATLEHHHLGLTDIHAAVGLPELFDTLFVLESYPFDPAGLLGPDSGLRLEGLDGHDATHYPLTIRVIPGERLRITFGYRPELLSGATVTALADQLLDLLAAAIADPDRPVGAIGAPAGSVASAGTVGAAPAATRPEEDEPTGAWATDTTLPELFEAQAARVPDAVAVTWGERRLTYAELDAAANRLARLLATRGVEPESLVAVALPRSIDLVVALLAVQKAGAAYLPLDTAYPADRLAFMLSDAAPVCLVTSTEALPALPARTRVPMIALDAPPVVAALAEQSPARLPAAGRARPENAAYVIYTSGSTGRPKGVVVPHQTVTRLFAHTQPWFGFDETDVWTMFHSASFDFSVWELWGPLLYGGRLVVVDHHVSRSPELFLDLLRRESVTVLSQTPSAFSQLIEADRAGGEDPVELALRYVVFGGEALDLGRLPAWYARHRDDAPVLVNMYGITETTVHVTYLRLDEAVVAAARASLVGGPIPGLRVHVLDQHLRPVAPGGLGELYVSGGQLARGYLGRPGLTATRFVADPFGGPGARMYRTGDLARRTADGGFEYLGRADDQVKVRGFRIELGEIQAAIATHPAVEQAVVLAREDQPGQRRLVGYVVAAPGRRVDSEELRRHAAAMLPEFMVPVAVLALDAFPLTGNGKLDRAALPAPDLASVSTGTRARTERERTLCAVFAGVLGLDEVGVDDDFFTLGGDSISAIQLVNRARREQVGFTPRDVFTHRTPAKLAARTEPAASAVSTAPDGPAAFAGPGAAPDRPGGAGTGLGADPEAIGVFTPLPIVSRLASWGGPVRRFNQAMLVSTPAGATVDLLRDAVQALLDQHDALRARLLRLSPALWLLETLPVGSARAGDLLRRVDIAGLDEAGLRAAVAAESAATADGLDPEAGAMLRVSWLDAGSDQPGRLLLVAHHLVVDGVSWRVLLADLRTAFAAVLAGRAPHLDPVGTSLRAFARITAERAQDPARLAELAHWTATLAPGGRLLGGAAAAPGAAPAAAGTIADTDRLVVELPARATAPLLTSVPAAAGTDVTAVLLAALRAAVTGWRRERGWDGSSDLLVDLERHGRDPIEPEVDLSRTVGWFTAISPVRLPASGGLASGGLAGTLEAVAGRLREIPDGGAGFGLLRYANAAAAPVLAGAEHPEVLFNYLGRFGADAADAWAPAPEFDALAAEPDPAMGVAYPLTVDAVSVQTPDGPVLRTTLTYLTTVIDRTAADALATAWLAALDGLAGLADDAVLAGAAAQADTAGPAAVTGADGAAGPAATGDLVELSPAERARVERVSPGPVAEIWPLSPLQEGLFFHSAFDRSSDAYTAQFALDFGHRFDVDRLRRACETFMRRNPTLRAGFLGDGLPAPLQFVVTELPAPLEEIDLTGLPAAERAERAELLARRDRERPFDVSNPPLWRLTLLRLGPDHDRLVFNRQVLVWDGWSGALVIDQLLGLYERGGGDEGLPVPAGSYRDFLVWLRARDTAGAEDAWRAALADLDGPTLVVPEARGLPPIEPERITTELAESTARAVRELSRRHGITVNTVFNAALALVLGNAVGSGDVVFGTTVAGRPTDVEGIDEVIGLFLNTVPVRVRLDPRESVLDLLRRVQDQRVDVMDHEYLGLGDIQRASGRTQLFDTLYVLQNFIDEVATEQSSDRFGITGGTSIDHTHYPLTFVLFPGTRITMRLEYRPDVVGAQRAAALFDRFRGLLDELVRDVTVPVGSVEVLLPAERAELAARWAEPFLPVGTETVADMLAAQVARTPDLTALVFGDERVSYADLDARVNRMARLLLARGAGPETVVALGLGRSVNMVVALFAVLRTGAAYLPLELDHPPARLLGMVADAGAALLVATDATAAYLDGAGAGPDEPVPRLLLDDPAVAAELAATGAGELSDAELGLFARDRADRLDHPAYVIYTSGSTGRPKGVVTPYRGLTNMQLNHREEIFAPAVAAAGGRRLRIAHTVSFAFDMSWEELLWLVEGHEVHVCDENLRRDAEALVAYCDVHRVDVVNVTPTYAHHLFELGLLDRAEDVPAGPPATVGATAEAGSGPGGLHRPPLVMLGGEAVSEAVWNRLRDTADTAGYNLYGPTEYTINTLGAGTADSPTPTVGRPIRNTRAYVLDGWLHPVPDGVPGELYIAGDGLARGYLDRFALTATRFVADPRVPGGRMYRTGDLVVRGAADGNLDFLGRTDEQVKIRGYRVELGEITAALDRHPRVSQAAVVAADDTGAPGTRRLVAYVVPAELTAADRAAVEADQVGEWRQVYSDEYVQIPTAVHREDFAGWDSSYDGQPIALEHMRQWRAATVERIRELAPRRILEIGVGTGLLLGQLAPECDSYWGTDFAAPVIDKLRAETAGDPRFAGLELRCQPAHVTDGLPAGLFDTIVINSVVQYFPSPEYLRGVLRAALELLAPGGALFVGDVRNLARLRAFHTAIEVSRSGLGGLAEPAGGLRDADLARLAPAVDRRVRLDKELVLAPEFFTALASETGAELSLRVKRGSFHNELTRHRFDVVLRRPAAPPEPPPEPPVSSAERPIPSAAPPVRLGEAPVLVWGHPVAGTDAIEAHLRDRRPPMLRVAAIPDARVAGELALAARVAGRDVPGGAAAPERAVDAEHAVDPEELFALADRLGYEQHLTLSAAGPGLLDAVFVRAVDVGAGPRVDGYLPDPAGGEAVPPLANDPTAARGAAALAALLRADLTTALPDYMVPAAYVTLSEIPRTANGKLDVASLPPADPAVALVASRPASSPAEVTLCELYAEVLGLPEVGVEDDFFALGGHSLLATRLVSRARAALGADLAIRDLFEAPTVAALAARVGSAAGTGPAASTRPPLVPVDRPERIALSPAQRRLWLVDRFADGTSAYNYPLVIRLRGEIDVDALSAAAADVSARHEVLRTVVEEHDGEGYQRILDPLQARPEVRAVDCSPADAIPGGAIPDGLDELLAQAVAEPFDLHTDPPLRLAVFRLGPADSVLLIVLHHIATDEWSDRPFLEDLDAAYTARRAGRAPGWEPLPVQYADYTLWQRELLGEPADPGSVAGGQLVYWAQALRNLPEEIALPLDRPRPVERDGAGGREVRELPAATATALRALCARTGASMSMLAHASVATLLHRLGAGDDVPLGVPIAGRNDIALDRLVGFFVNTLVLRSDLSGDPTFAELLARTRETDLAAFDNSDVPFEQVVAAINPRRSAGRNPLFQVMTGYHHLADDEHTLLGLPTEWLRTEAGTVKFDLDVTFVDRSTSNQITLLVQYARDVLDTDTARRLADRMVDLLGQLARDPDRRVSQLAVLDDAERDLVLASFNRTHRDVVELTWPAAFEARVDRSPESVAVVCEDVELTYAELDARANRLARLLADRGTGPEDVVAVAVPRSVDLVVALLGVMKAGAAYLPLDLDHPADRVTFMIEDADARLLVSTRGHAEELMALGALGWAESGPDLVLLDEPATMAELAAREPTRPSVGALRAAGLDGAAYVIYTSGSTGRPKGVVVTHEGVGSLVATAVDRLGVDENSRVVQFASVGFDVAVFDLCMALCVGGRAIIVPAERRVAGPELTDYLAHHGATHMILPPSLVAALPADCELPAGAVLVVGTETVPIETVRRWSRDLRVVAAYGLTEATVNSTLWPADPDWSGSVPIGVPDPNTRAYVLDTALHPVGVGVVGELYVGGRGLARGYLGRAGLTAQRFVADPFGQPGGRLYRTGDQARWRPGGVLDFLGRSDDQIKIRGHRIEPGEVQSVLMRHPGVRQAIVLAREDRPGSPQLVAYVVPADPAAADPAALRAHAAEHLPEYMVPAAVVLVPGRLPMTPNGKLDRAALPPPRFALPAAGRAPASATEARLCELFAEVLGLGDSRRGPAAQEQAGRQPAVGVDDDFFALGGDSIISMRLVSRLRADGFVVRPAQVFRHRTPAELAAALTGAGALPGTVTTTGAGPLPRAVATAGAVATAVDGVGVVPPTPPLLALRAAGGGVDGFSSPMLLHVPASVTLPALRAVLAAVAERHEILRARLVRAATGTVPDGLPATSADGGEAWYLDVPPPGPAGVGSWLRRVEVGADDDLDRTLAAEALGANRELDPDAGAMVRVVWFDAGRSSPGRLLVLVHHLVIDGVSWRIILDDLAAAWNVLTGGGVPALAPVPTSYRRWALGVTEQALRPEREAELAYWLRTVEGGAPLPRPAGAPSELATGEDSRLAATIPETWAGDVLVVAPAVWGVGVDEILLAALALAVADCRRRWEGTQAVGLVVALQSHGRVDPEADEADLTRTVGWFADVHPLCLDQRPVDLGDPAAGAALDAAVAAVHRRKAETPRGGSGYGLLRHLNPRTAPVLARAGQPAVYLNYEGRWSRPEPADWDVARENEGLLAGWNSERADPFPLTVIIRALDLPGGLRLVTRWTSGAGGLPASAVSDLATAWTRALAALAARARHLR